MDKEQFYYEIAAIGDCLGAIQGSIHSTETSNAIGYLGQRLKTISEQLLTEKAT